MRLDLISTAQLDWPSQTKYVRVTYRNDEVLLSQLNGNTFNYPLYSSSHFSFPSLSFAIVNIQPVNLLLTFYHFSSLWFSCSPNIPQPTLTDIFYEGRSIGLL